MTRIFKTSVGEMNQFIQNLHAAGFTREDVERINHNTVHAQQMYTAILPDASVIIEPPSWYVSPEQQLERVWELNAAYDWGFKDSDIPTIPRFTLRTETEVLMLAVYLRGRNAEQSGRQRTFDELWDLTKAPAGYTKFRWEGLKSDRLHLRLVPGYEHRPGIRWVAFDPNAYQDESPVRALALAKQDNVQLAGVEVLMAALLFPNWATSWNDGSISPPTLSGLQLLWTPDWSYVPCLNRWDGRLKLRLSARWADSASSNWASPTVREC